MIQFTGEKMAKSVGNIALLGEVIGEFGAEAVVMYLISGHYRQPLAFSPSELTDAVRRVQRVRDALRRLQSGAASPPDMAQHKDAFFAALANDFNTPTALAALFEWVREANRRGDGVGDADLREMLETLGLGALTRSTRQATPTASTKRPRRCWSSASRRAASATSPEPTRSASSCAR